MKGNAHKRVLGREDQVLSWKVEVSPTIEPFITHSLHHSLSSPLTLFTLGASSRLDTTVAPISPPHRTQARIPPPPPSSPPTTAGES